MTDDFDVSLRRRLQSLAAAVPLSAAGAIEGVMPRGVQAGSGGRLGFAGFLPLLALVVGGALVAGIAQLGPQTGPPPQASAVGGTDPSNGPIQASTRSGDFVLTIRSAKATYAAGERIEIEALLAYDGAEPVQIAHGLGGAGGPVGFGIEEPVLGGLHLAPTTRDACVTTALEPGQTLAYGFAKSGGFSNDDPRAEDFKHFFEDPELQLETGTWHVYADASFDLGMCSAAPTNMRASLVVDVVDAPIPTLAPTATVGPDGGVSASDRDGDFELSLESDKATYLWFEPIDISAALTYSGPESNIKISHDDAGPLLFRIREKVFGEIQVGGVSDLRCDSGDSSTLERGVPLTSPFLKTGGYPGDHPDAERFHDWMTEPVLRLPAGTWHISVASSHPCMSAGPAFSVEAEITVVVVGRGAAPHDTVPPGDDDVIPLTTSPGPAAACAQALGGGPLSLNPRTGLGFTKASGDLVDVTWPFGYSAHRERGLAVLVDERGRVVAREGDSVMSAGGWGEGDKTFTSCGLDPWAGTPIALTTSDVPRDGCPDALSTGRLVPEPRSGLGIAKQSGYLAQASWPFGYTARDVYGIAVLLDPEDNVVAWQGGMIAFSGGGPDGAVALICGDIERINGGVQVVETP